MICQLILFFSRNNGTIKFLTKGDNNSVDDRGLYAPGQQWLEKSDMVGRARGFLPYVGMVTILMNEYPKVKVRFKQYIICSFKSLNNYLHLNLIIKTNIFYNLLIYLFRIN